MIVSDLKYGEITLT